MATTKFINTGELLNLTYYDLSLDEKAEKLSNIPSADGGTLENIIKDILSTNNTFLEKNPNMLDSEYEKPSKSGVQLCSCANFYSVTEGCADRKAYLENLKEELATLYKSSNDDTISKLDQLKNAGLYVKATDIYRVLSCKSTAERREVYKKIRCNETLFCGLFDIAFFERGGENTIICASICNNFYGNEELLGIYKNASGEEARQLYLDNIEVDQMIALENIGVDQTRANTLGVKIVYDVEGRRNNKSVALLVDIATKNVNRVAQVIPLVTPTDELT